MVRIISFFEMYLLTFHLPINRFIWYFKLMLPNMGSKQKVTFWVSGTPEQFILHVHSAIHACKQMEHDVKFSSAKEAVATAHRGCVGMYYST